MRWQVPGETGCGTSVLPMLVFAFLTVGALLSGCAAETEADRVRLDVWFQLIAVAVPAAVGLVVAAALVIVELDDRRHKHLESTMPRERGVRGTGSSRPEFWEVSPAPSPDGRGNEVSTPGDRDEKLRGE